jgi:hypothetical protein
MGTFGVELGRNIVRAKKASHEVIALSLQQTVTLAQLPIYQGGRMPILTGFLRSSIRIQLMRSGATFQWGACKNPVDGTLRFFSRKRVERQRR